MLTSSAVSSSKDILLRQCSSPPERVIWWVGSGNVIAINWYTAETTIFMPQISAKLSNCTVNYRECKDCLQAVHSMWFVPEYTSEAASTPGSARQMLPWKQCWVIDKHGRQWGPGSEERMTDWFILTVLPCEHFLWTCSILLTVAERLPLYQQMVCNKANRTDEHNYLKLHGGRQRHRRDIKYLVLSVQTILKIIH